MRGLIVRSAGAEIETTATARVENVSTLARLAFEEKSGKVLLRAIVRALGKYALKKEADKADGALGLLVNIVGVATESADTRSWTTLPSKILMARLHLPPGNYDIEVELLTGTGALHDTFTIPNVTVKPSDAQFINYRVY